jgi:hypothetical protein
MKITINITNHEANHIKEHTFYDCCGEVDDIMRKVQKKVKEANHEN